MEKSTNKWSFVLNLIKLVVYAGLTNFGVKMHKENPVVNTLKFLHIPHISHVWAMSTLKMFWLH